MTTAPPSLTVAFSTLGSRVCDLAPGDWPRAPGLDYLVLVQDPEADARIAPALETLGARADVTVVCLASRGLSRSRNAALDRARGDILLIADDDVTHLPGAYEGIRRFFAENPGAALLTGQSFDPAMRPRKRFAPRPHALSVWNSAGVSSHELALRRAPVAAAGVRFDEAFGVGAGTVGLLGEEYIFIADCLRAGLRGTYAPLPVSVHPAESSGFIWRGEAVARARAAVFTRVFARGAVPVRLAFALKNLRRFGAPRDIWRFLRG